MGAYLAKPLTEKLSDNGSNKWLSYGSSSMQGWRRTQEDAHNCIPEFDPKRTASYFAVYDGHGGADVANYCSTRLPDFLLNRPQYSDIITNPIELLQNTFIDFDSSLTTPEVKTCLNELKTSEHNSLNTDRSEADNELLDEDEANGLEELDDIVKKPFKAIIDHYKQEGESMPVFLKAFVSNFRPNFDKPDSVPSSSDSEESNKAATKPITEEKAVTDLNDTAELTSTGESSPSSEEGEGECVEKESDEVEPPDCAPGDEDWHSHFWSANSMAYEPGVNSGSTACVALIVPEVEEGLSQQPVRVCVYVANAGDSRAVLCRGRAAVDLSVDHKPEDSLERARIVAAGGTVTADGRVNDGLNLSRAIGDHIYKRRNDLKLADQMISALPDVSRTELVTGADEFLVIACDGIWNSMTSQQVVDFVYDRLHPSTSDDEQDTLDVSKPAHLSDICEELFEQCLAPNTIGDGTGCDNMTCIIVRFDDLEALRHEAAVRVAGAGGGGVAADGVSRKRLEFGVSAKEANCLNGQDCSDADRLGANMPVMKKPRTEEDPTVNGP